MGHSVNAFDLSAQFLHPRGLLEALDLVDADPASGTSLGVGVGLNSRFRELVRVQAAQKGTESVPFATYCMQWLEAKGRPIAALEVGKLAPSQLNLFLEVCLSIYLFICLSFRQSAYLFDCMAVSLSVCLSSCLCLPVSLSNCLSACLSACLFIYLPFCLSAYFFIHYCILLWEAAFVILLVVVWLVSIVTSAVST